MTFSLELAKVLEGVCNKLAGKGDWHRHIQLIGIIYGKRRTALAAAYPPKFVMVELRVVK